MSFNKLEGFYRLKKISLPTVGWKKFEGNIEGEGLFTVRCAVFEGMDRNLPRLVGAPRDEAQAFATRLSDRLDGRGIIIYYPYFVAELSGTLRVDFDSHAVECCKGDLWNLVTDGKCDYSAEFDKDGRKIYRGDGVLSPAEESEFYDYADRIRRAMRDEIAERSVLSEWSFARNCDKNGVPVGPRYTVFYELRTV